jgi:hypothetical protein
LTAITDPRPSPGRGDARTNWPVCDPIHLPDNRAGPDGRRRVAADAGYQATPKKVLDDLPEKTEKPRARVLPTPESNPGGRSLSTGLHRGGDRRGKGPHKPFVEPRIHLSKSTQAASRPRNGRDQFEADLVLLINNRNVALPAPSPGGYRPPKWATRPC